MLSRGWVVLVVLAKCVVSIPVSTTHMDNEDVQVIKCIVEVLADVLSKPHSIPVSQQCLQTLRTDDRLVTVLRHHNFLQELQDIAVEGANERTEKGMKDSTDYVSNHSEDPAATADRSMLVAMERPGEEKRGEDEERDRERKERDQKTQEHNHISSQEKRNEEEEDSDTTADEQERKRASAMKEGVTEDEEEKRSSLEEEEADEAVGAGEHSEAKKSAEEDESQEEQETGEKRRESPGHLEKEEKAKAGVKHWSRTRQLVNRRAEMGAYDQQEAPHHSKEVTGQGNGEVWKSPEEQELQMMARSDPEDRREEEGSASKKTETPQLLVPIITTVKKSDAEIESLAAIESELENVAQKLHELRRG